MIEYYVLYVFGYGLTLGMLEVLFWVFVFKGYAVCLWGERGRFCVGFGVA